MGKKNARDLLLAFSLINASDYSQNTVFDPEVDECLMNMYFYIMYGNINEEKKKEYFNEFEKCYNKLNEEQQEIVRKDYFDIIESKNNKGKVKNMFKDAVNGSYQEPVLSIYAKYIKSESSIIKSFVGAFKRNPLVSRREFYQNEHEKCIRWIKDYSYEYGNGIVDIYPPAREHLI